MKFVYSKELYPKLAVIKAAYNYTDRFFIHLDADSENYIVEIEAKDNKSDVDIKEFENEMLIQLARYEVLESTKDVRKIVLARSMASTLIDDESVDEENDDIDMSDILKDWFANE